MLRLKVCIFQCAQRNSNTEQMLNIQTKTKICNYSFFCSHFSLIKLTVNTNEFANKINFNHTNRENITLQCAQEFIPFFQYFSIVDKVFKYSQAEKIGSSLITQKHLETLENLLNFAKFLAKMQLNV